MARAQTGTIRLKLLKIGAVVIRNTRCVSLHLSTACPDKALFLQDGVAFLCVCNAGDDRHEPGQQYDRDQST